MINMFYALFDRIRFRIKPPKIAAEEYWWVNIQGSPHKVQIISVDGKVVTARVVNGFNIVQYNFIKDVRWISKCQD